MNRKQAREQVFIITFEKEFNSDPLEVILEYAAEAEIYKQNEFSDKELCGIYENLGVIDKTIEENLKNWTLRRLSKVSLAILRLAVYEILFDETIPDSVSINEAVELAKKYGAEDDSKYVNGVLGSVVKNK